MKDLYPPGYIPPADLSGAEFVKPSEPYRKMMKCKKCGAHFILETPYEKCNPDLRDLCVDCIFEFIENNPDYGTVPGVNGAD